MFGMVNAVKMFLSLVLSGALGLMFFAGIAFAGKMMYGRVGRNNWLAAAGIGATIGVINFFIPSFAPGTPVFWLAPICYVAMMAFYAFLIAWWRRDGSDLRELIPFVIMAIVAYFTTMATAAMTAALAGAFLASVFMALPKIVLVGTLGFFAANLFWFMRKLHEGDDNRVRVDKIVAIVVAAATAVIMVIMVITLINWGSLFPKKAETEATVETVATEAVEVAAEVTEEVAATQVQEELPAETALTIEETWYMYYHYLLLNDDNLADDFDFGPTAWAEGLTAEEALEEMIARVKADPALGAAAFASFDVRLGTDLMYPGIHYDQNWSDGYWTSLISQYVKVYQADEVLYRKLVDRWEEFVRKYAQVTLTYQEGIKDQMYMISLTSASELEAPEVIVAAADQPSGHVLNFAFLIKGNQFNVPFRTDCGFQPTNVAEPMKETPKELPKDPQISSGGGGSTPSGGSDPAPRKKKQTERQTEHQTEKQTERQTNPPETGTPQTGTPETPKPQPETPKPQPETPKQTEKQTDPPQPETPKPQTETSKPQPETPKDPSKSTTVNVAPNDDPGITGDVSTNNGDGATTSTAELPANSNNMTQPEYVETVQELAQINAEQKTGSEPSIPSTPTVQPASAQPAQSAQPAEPVSVDNPADNPATVAPINDATPQVAADTVAGDPESVGMIGTPD